MHSYLKKIVVIGAAGKMGRGISMVILGMLLQKKTFSHLTFIDNSYSRLSALKATIKKGLFRIAEKMINSLRKDYIDRKDLVSNQEIIQAYVDEILDKIVFSTNLDEAAQATLVFEAIIEDATAKAATFMAVSRISSHRCLFFTNTSSIPIHTLEEKSGLFSRIVGFHFYNPPEVQRLVEIIASKNTPHELLDFALELAKDLKKEVVISKDVPGFIGNGHFMEEILYAWKLVEELAERMSLEKAIYLINGITQHLLIRPMGIFQLVDYVGLDICQNILNTMRASDQTHFSHLWIDRLIAHGILGGQTVEGEQKPGIFDYQHGKPIRIISMDTLMYVPIDFEWETALKPLPDAYHPWKELVKASDQKEKLSAYYEELEKSEIESALLAKRFLKHSREIVAALVKRRVAKTNEDVDKVLQLGFYHLPLPQGVP